jgi:hypothetical protein
MEKKFLLLSLTSKDSTRLPQTTEPQGPSTSFSFLLIGRIIMDVPALPE